MIQSQNRGTGHRKLDPQCTTPVPLWACALKTRVNAHGQCTHFYAPYHPCFLVVSSMHKPLLSAGRKGEGVTGATPLFCGSCGARHPFQLTLRVSVAALPGGGRSRHNNPCGKARIPEAEMA